MTQREKALRFHQLHRGEGPLVLANVWDPGTARVVASTGAAALATTSAGVSWALGTRDHGRLGRDRALEIAARVAAAVDLPVTADLEDGYGATPAEVGRTIELLLAAGAIGVNLEDGAAVGDPAAVSDPAAPLRTVEDQAARIAAARAAADRAGIPLFINARTDVYLYQVGAPATRLKEAVDRARVYAEAGADGIFVPVVTDRAEIAALAAELPLPLNVMAGPGSPSVPELGALGVARVSLGASLALAAFGAVRRAAAEALGSGTYEALRGGPAYAELDALFD